MGFERNKFIVRSMNQKRVITHDELMNRIRKSLYYGDGTSFNDMKVSRPLAEYASELFSEPHKGHSLNRLSIVTAGGIHTNPCALIIALIYLDRLNASDSNYIRRITPSELFIVSMMISTKFYSDYDEQICLSEWAEQGDLSEERIKELELEFLYALDWKAYISNIEFFEKLELIEKTVAQREGIRRGWLTYTELINLLPSFTIAKFVLNNFVIIAVGYAASVMTLAGAFFIYSHIPGNLLINNELQSNHSDIIGTSTIPTVTTTTTTVPTTPITTTSSLIIESELNRNIPNKIDVNHQNFNINDELLQCQTLNIENELKMLIFHNDERQHNNNDLTNECTDYVNDNHIMKNLQNNNYWQNDYDNDKYYITVSIMKQIKTTLWYLIKDDRKSLNELIPFEWFKFT